MPTEHARIVDEDTGATWIVRETPKHVHIDMKVTGVISGGISIPTRIWESFIQLPRPAISVHEQNERRPGGWTPCDRRDPHAPHQMSYDPWRGCPGIGRSPWAPMMVYDTESGAVRADETDGDGMTTWDVKTADWASKRLEELLAEGYEPFAAVGDRQGHVVYLKRQIVQL